MASKVYPIPTDKQLKNFEDYVEKFCAPLPFKTALMYANLGEEYLKLFCLPSNELVYEILAEGPKNITTETIAGCMLWCLVKKSYDAGLPFGKGMFNIKFADKECTSRLYDFLNTASYARISSHYNNYVSGHRGLDDDHSSIQWPWLFKTIVFGLCHPGKESAFLYFKPERYGLDFLHHPVAAANHLYSWGQYLLHPQRLPGTDSYRETEHKEIIVQVTLQEIDVHPADRGYANSKNRSLTA